MERIKRRPNKTKLLLDRTNNVNGKSRFAILDIEGEDLPNNTEAMENECDINEEKENRGNWKVRADMGRKGRRASQWKVNPIQSSTTDESRMKRQSIRLQLKETGTRPT